MNAFHLAFRSLTRRRAYALVVIALLGLGIGVNTAIFGVVDAVLLRSLPYRDADSVFVLYADGSARGGTAQVPTTPGDFADWRAQSRDVFSGIAALRNISPRITSFETPVVPLTQAVTANFFDVLGAAPYVGRVFRDGEDTPGNDAVVMLSYGMWQTKFGGDPAVIGRTIDLDARPYAVVGVMGPDFYTPHIFNVQPELWIPATFDLEREDRAARTLLAYGRLKPGVTLGAAAPAMRAIAARLAQEHPQTGDRWSIALTPIRELAIGGFTRIAALVLVAVGLVLLMACANVANLALARGIERSADVAVRSALGASRRRIFSEIIAESLVLSAMGAAVGTAVAWLVMPALVALIPTSAGVPFLNRASLDARVLAFEIAIAMVCGLIAGALPARQSLRIDVVDALRSAGRGRVAGPASRWRNALVTLEVALAIVVVTCAVLMTRTLVGLQHVAPGFNADRIAKVRTSLRGDAFAAPAARVRHFEELQRQLAAMPGIASASAVSLEPPLQSLTGSSGIRLPGAPVDSAAPPSAIGRVVMPDYFETMGIPVVSGRGITRDDRADTALVAVISQSMARRYFSDVDPIGRTFSLEAPRAMPFRIVGVAGDVITAGVDPTPVPAFYTPYPQSAPPAMTMVINVRAGDASAVLRRAEQIAWSISPFTNVYAVETMAQRLAELNWRTRFAVVVLGGFAVVGMLLAAAGLYAVVSYTVQQRRREIGLRMALGADAFAILVDVVSGGLRPVVAGVVIGDLAALAFARTLNGMLYGVAPSDPSTIVIVSVATLVIAVAASVLPALTAARIDPQLALSGER